MNDGQVDGKEVIGDDVKDDDCYGDGFDGDDGDAGYDGGGGCDYCYGYYDYLSGDVKWPS